MKPILTQFLCCPTCRHDLSLTATEYAHHNEISQGHLSCNKCNKQYPIIGGVPVFGEKSVETDITNRAFSDQWKLRQSGRFERETIFGFDPREYNDHWNYAFSLTDSHEIKNNLVLEVGFGSGNLVIALAAKMDRGQVLGLDLSDTVFEVYRAHGHLASLHIIQGDIQRSPLKSKIVDYAFSSGVMHHLAHPEIGIRNLWEAVTPGGKCYVWVYPSYTFCIYDFVRRLLLSPHRLPSSIRMIIAKSLAPLLWLFFRCTKKFSYGRANETLATIAFRLFDNLSPEFQFRYTKTEVLELCSHLNIPAKIINDLGFVAHK
jgi:SAM-dependent methyltransferase/uncharacterized protein YbaR (Trm112 family)